MWFLNFLGSEKKKKIKETWLNLSLKNSVTPQQFFLKKSSNWKRHFEFGKDNVNSVNFLRNLVFRIIWKMPPKKGRKVKRTLDLGSQDVVGKEVGKESPLPVMRNLSVVTPSSHSSSPMPLVNKAKANVKITTATGEILKQFVIESPSAKGTVVRHYDRAIVYVPTHNQVIVSILFWTLLCNKK